ncbi:MAG: sulfotransferase family protein [Pirellulaceae bacterium]
MALFRNDNDGQPRANSYPFYAPRFWAGMGVSDYVGMMARNRFRVHLSRWPMVGLVGGCTVASSALALFQRMFLNRKIENTELAGPPIFVVGHWRSGTTLLHELLSLDEEFAYPTTFQCFVPTHHVASRPFIQPLVKLLMPSRRPMDAMPAGADLPQEDEFAMPCMGAPSPYFFLAFCREQAPWLEMLNFEGADPADIESLRNAITWFYKSVTYKKDKRLVLKSPTHTGRIAHLSRWFPGARFVHITRHPYKIFPSTVHLWKSLCRYQGYQLVPRDDQVFVDYVHECYQRMYAGYFSQIDEIPRENVVEIRFEEMLQDPEAAISGIYEQFELPGFEKVQPRINEFWSQRKSHRRNKTQLDETQRRQVDEIWGDYMERFEYEPESKIRAARPA